MHYRPIVEKKDELKQENAAGKEGVKKREKAAVTQINMNAKMLCKEGSGETDGGYRGKSICCVLNCESFIPCPVIKRLKNCSETVCNCEGMRGRDRRSRESDNQIRNQSVFLGESWVFSRSTLRCSCLSLAMIFNYPLFVLRVGRKAYLLWIKLSIAINLQKHD
ncbi:hypothetical protein M5689_003412 [Euphorbia peplus]|nr:hypothetical protein M5689_003412 [Euphorbia peplus]